MSLSFFLSFLSFFFPLSFPVSQGTVFVGVLAGVADGVDCGFVGVWPDGIVGGVVGELPGVVVLVGAPEGVACGSRLLRLKGQRRHCEQGGQKDLG